MQAFTGNHILLINLSGQTGPAWPKASGMQKHSCQAEYSKISGVRPLSGMDRACHWAKWGQAVPRAGGWQLASKKAELAGKPSGFPPPSLLPAVPALLCSLVFPSLLFLSPATSFPVSSSPIGTWAKSRSPMPPASRLSRSGAPTPPRQCCVSSSPCSSLCQPAP